MNPLLYTKAIVAANGSIVRRYYGHRSLHIDNNKLGIFIPYYKRKTELRVTSQFRDAAPSEICPINVLYVPIRKFHFDPTWRGQEPSSKVEETVKSIKEENERKDIAKDLAQAEEKAIAKKRTMWQKIKAELLHYYHGFRLLGLDMKISVKLLWRMVKGNELSRREHRLLIKTTGDMFRLIPFSVFIIVPFMEFLLPVVIKFFPGMLPSTFQTANDKEDKLKQALKVKIEMAKFLQQTLDDMAVQSSDHTSKKAKEFSEFFYKLRSTGTDATTEEIMKFSKLFEDEITLDSLSRPQLVALCRVLDVQTIGTTNFLRFLLRMKLRSLVADDRLIDKEGVDTLTRAELQQACRARGMRAYGMPENRLRDQLAQWLDLSINKKVPSSLLLLSRALMVPDTMAMSDKLKATISALPDDVLARTKGAIGEKEGKIDHRTYIEIIKLEERKIEEERREKSEKEVDEPKPTILATDDKEDEITTTDVKVLEQALDSIGKENKKMAVEKEEIKDLKEEMAEYQEDIQELDQMMADARGKSDIEHLKVSKGAKRLFTKVTKMIGKMDAVLVELEQSEKQVKEKLDSLASEEKVDPKAVEELVRIDELIAAIKKIQSVPDDFRLKRMTEILGKIDDDRDGAIKIEDVLKVVELIGNEDVKLSKKQVNELIDLMDKEGVLEVEDQIQKALKKESKDAKDTSESEKSTSVSTVPATPVTKEDKLGKEEFDEEETKTDKKTSTTTSSSTINSRDVSSTLDKDSEKVRTPPIAPGVPPPTKKAEGSKQL